MIASSTGIPAATSAPNAKIRMISVSGTDSVRAFAKSSLKLLFSALVALASPACWITISGWARCAAAVAASDGPTRLSASLDLPVMLNPTSTE